MIIKIRYEIESPISGVGVGDTIRLYKNDTPSFIKHIPLIRNLFFDRVVVDGVFWERWVTINVLQGWNTALWVKDFESHNGAFYVLNKLDGKERELDMPKGKENLQPKIIKEISSVMVHGDNTIQRTVYSPQKNRQVFTKEYGFFLRDVLSYNIRWNVDWEPVAVVVDGGYIKIENF